MGILEKIQASIVMAVRNEEKHLSDCLSSILQNQYNNYEIIIVNDASTDNTSNIIARYETKFRYVTVINNTSPLGLAASLNLGITEARADLIIRMDGDDLMECTRIQKQITFMNNNLNVDIMGTNVTLINDQGVTLGRTSFPLSSSEIKEKLKRTNVIAHPSVIFRKSKIQEIGAYDDTYSRSQDYELWRRCLKNDLNFENISDELVKYRYTGVKDMRSIYEQFKTYVRIAIEYKDIMLLIIAITTFAKNLLVCLEIYREKAIRE